MPPPATNTAPAADPAQSAQLAEEARQAFSRMLAELQTMGLEIVEESKASRGRYGAWLEQFIAEVGKLKAEFAACLDPETIDLLDVLYRDIKAISGVIVRNLKG